MRTYGRNEHGTRGGTLHNITYSSGAVRAEVPCLPEALAHAGEPSPSPRVEHKLTIGFGMRREESAPAAVVAPATRGYALAAPEAQPPLHVCFGNPHPIWAGALSEYHDVRHTSMIEEAGKC